MSSIYQTIFEGLLCVRTGLGIGTTAVNKIEKNGHVGANIKQTKKGKCLVLSGMLERSAKKEK